MYCYYIDHEIFDGGAEDLAELSAKFKTLNILPYSEGVSLITCHRIEFYSIRQNHGFRKQLPVFFRTIDNQTQVARRLFEISLGLHSQIVAENSIYFQTAYAVNLHLYANPSNVRLLDLLKLSKSIRDEFNFYSPNHGQLIYRHLSKQKPRPLILVGAGMLNRKILESIDRARMPKQIFLVTRNKSKAKIDFKELMIDNLVITDLDLLTKERLAPSNMFVATNDMDYLYEKKIRELCESNKPQYITDLSSTPIKQLRGLTGQNNYFSLFTPNTENLTNEQNLITQDKRRKVEEFIKQTSNFELYV